MRALISRLRKQKRRRLIAAALFCAVLTVAAAWPQRSPGAATQLELDLDADTDHTGFVEHSAQEDEREDKDGEEGLIVLPNWDDDDPPGTAGHGVPDCLIENRFSRAAFPERRNRFDNEINGAKDKEEDLEFLTLRKIPALSSNVKIVLRVSKDDAEKVRIFDENDRAVIAPAASAAFIAHKAGKPNNEHEVTNLQGPSDQFLEYRVEGILPGEHVRVELVALDDTRELARDTVRVRVAPFLLLPNERPVRQAITADFRSLPPRFRLAVLPGLSAEEDAVRQAAAELAPTVTAPPTDNFWQDPIQPGYAVAPGPGRPRTMILLARLPRGARNFWDPRPEAGIPPEVSREAEAQHWLWPNRPSSFLASANSPYPALLGPSVGVFEVSDFSQASVSDFGGNLEVTWPLPDQGKPFGRAVVGREMSSAYRDFLNRQEVQAPLVELELAWLYNRHVDDVVYFLSGKQAAVPSPGLGERLLSEIAKTNQNSNKALFIKGLDVLAGRFTGVERAGEHLVLTDTGADLSVVRPGMYLHVFEGKGRYQTYDILNANSRAMVVQEEAARFFSFWRSEPVETPAPGSRYIVVERPLHDTRSRVLVITLSELFDREEVRTDNRKVREFWSQNRAADENIRSKILPEIRKLSPARIIELPVLFHETSAADRTGSSAFTPNLVNGQLFGGTFLMPKPFVLRTPSGGDLFEEASRQALGGFKTRFVDDYFLFHNFGGEVHCALNVLLEPPGAGPYWWER